MSIVLGSQYKCTPPLVDLYLSAWLPGIGTSSETFNAAFLINALINVLFPPLDQVRSAFHIPNTHDQPMVRDRLRLSCRHIVYSVVLV